MSVSHLACHPASGSHPERRIANMSRNSRRNKPIRDALIAASALPLGCWYCRRTFSDASHLTLDHKIPQCFGGRTDVDNCVLACRQCNIEKGPLTADQFMRLRHDHKKRWLARKAIDRAVTGQSVPRIRRSLQSALDDWWPTS